MGSKNQTAAARVQDEHESLKTTMTAIRAEIKSPLPEEDFGEWKLGFIWRLRDFQNELVKHFDLEEDGGFMQDLVNISPGCASRVEVLKQEHDDIIPRLNELTDRLKRISTNNDEDLGHVAEDVLSLFDLLERHEAAERELIQDVFFQDIGVGD